MRLFSWVRRRALLVWLLTTALSLAGLVSAAAMPSGIYPEVEFRRIVVLARMGGAPPEGFETAVTRPLEQALASVMGVERMRSKTIRGAVEISLQLVPGTDVWQALQMTEARANEVRASLGADAEVIVERVTTGSFPVVTFNVSGAVDPRELRELSENLLGPAISGVPGVGNVEISGGDVREVEIVLDPEATASLGLSASSVAERVRGGMGLHAVGRLNRDRQLVTIVSDAEPRSLAEIRDLPVTTSEDGVPVALGSIAEVVEGKEDRLVQVAGPGGATVGLAVSRLPGASTPDVVQRVMQALRDLRPSLPAGVTVTPVYDQASLVREAMASVRDAILVGILLCAGVIALFLRDLRAGLLASFSVPITLTISFLVMRLGHQTLNLMSLGGMAVATGLVVDDAIVIAEAISTERQRGLPAAEAAAAGLTALAPAVIGTTVTTVVVFVPLAFLGGVVGEFFRALAFTVTTAVLVSLAVALVLVPLAASQGLGNRRPPAWGSWLRTGYTALVRRLARRPGLAAFAFLLLLGAGALAAPRLERGFLPSMDEGAFVLDYFLPAGTAPETTARFARRIDDELRQLPDVQTFTRRLGAELGPAAATELHRGDIMVRLVPRARRRQSAEATIAALRSKLEASLPEVRFEFVQVMEDTLADLAGNPRPIEVEIFGPDFRELQALGDTLAARLEPVAGLVDLYPGHDRDVPELRFVPDRGAAARLGTSPEALGVELESALDGVTVGSIRRDDRLLSLRVRYPTPLRRDPQQVLSLPLPLGGRTVSLASVTRSEWDTSPSSLGREAQQPMVAVTADHEGRDLGGVADDVARLARGLTLPPGYRIVLGGQIASQQAAVAGFIQIGLAGLGLVLMVLIAQFRRPRVALLVLASVPTAIVGAVTALLIAAVPLNASSLMGCVLLVGLVVKNGVLLLEEAERRVDAGQSPVEAVTVAGERRVRPVVMTTVATLAGLSPLALGVGAGAELQRPLAIAVIGGLITSTVATLVLLPPFAAVALRTGRSHRALPRTS